MTAASHLFKLGGKLQVTGDTKTITAVNMLPSTPWTCEWLSLNGCPLYPEEIQFLNPLGTIRKLDFVKTNLTDVDLLTIRPLLEKVMDLKLSHTQVSDSTMEWLANNRSMGQLDVDSTNVTTED